MAVYAGEQHGPRWRAAASGMVIRERKTFRREPGNVRGVNLAAKRGDIRVTKVISEYEYDVWVVRLLCAKESWGAQRGDQSKM